MADTIRPELTKAEVKVLMRGLEALQATVHTMDEMDPIRDVDVRLREAAMRKHWFDLDD